MKKITKILIANRGEIAVRIHRSAKELGINTVAVYSDPDRTMPHVLVCDEAYPLCGTSSIETYLNIEKIIAIALKVKADAIHPGYGFLSEKSSFETIELLGNKTSARAMMAAHNVPIVPGTTSPIQTIEEAFAIASGIGYPVLIKAAGGGGGKGMRRVDSGDELPAALDRARNEALKAFSDERIYIEKFIENPKHIEIQILADSHGNVIHLGERECSIQRRHQKVVEECPSTAISPALRNAMGMTAVTAAKSAGYINAGTVEFLLDSGQNYYFLEVNTRVQVEHPITEMVYGIDIVKEQLRIAEGANLSIAQSEVMINGHAIESRIYAEEVANNFLPSIGVITHYQPSAGPGVRNDAGVQSGSEISMHYDPMIAKLIVHARTRNDAIAKMLRALREYKINGVHTTIPFCEFVVDHPEFRKGTYDINFVGRYFQQPEITLSADERFAAAAAFAATAAISTSRPHRITENGTQSKWKKQASND